MAEPARHVPAAAPRPSAPRRPALYADYLQASPLLVRPTRAQNRRWLVEQLLRAVFVVAVIGAVLVVAWSRP